MGHTLKFVSVHKSITGLNPIELPMFTAARVKVVVASFMQPTAVYRGPANAS